MSHGLLIINGRYGTPDGPWLRFVPDSTIVGQIEIIAEKYTDNIEARAALTHALVALNKEGTARKAAEALAWIPDPAVGEVAAFGFPGVMTLRSAAEATAEMYAARPALQFADKGFKVLDHDARVVQCPAGPTVLTVTRQRQRRTTSIFWVAETVTFPQVEGLNEAWSIMLFTARADPKGLGGFVHGIANSLGVRIQRPDGTTFTVGPWDE